MRLTSLKPQKLCAASIFAILFMFSVMFSATAPSFGAGHIVPGGKVLEEASQLIVWYDTTTFGSPVSELPLLQVTNGSADTAVNIHVQIFADDEERTDLCREHDFTDTLTALDTVTYVLTDLDSPDTGPPPFGGDNVHAPIAIDLDFTRGFIVVTPVNQITLPRQAIAHNHLFGSITVTEFDGGPPVALKSPAVGRRAVSFATGEDAPDGTLLDGITNGFQLLQPSTLSFSFSLPFFPYTGEVFSITFTDNYSDPSGEYRAEPATAVWDPLMYDDAELARSCQQHINSCFVILRINGLTFNGPVDGDPTLCPSVTDPIGWALIAVSGLGPLDNNIGYTHMGFSDFVLPAQFTGTRVICQTREECNHKIVTTPGPSASSMAAQ